MHQVKETAKSMKVIHDLGDGVFEVANVADLERAVREFLAGKGIAADVRAEGDSVVVVYPDVSDIDADEDERIVDAVGLLGP